MHKKLLTQQWWFWISIAILVLSSILLLAFADCLTANSATMWAGVVSAISTIILGIIALWQNVQQQNDNDMNQKLLLDMERNNFIANFSTMVSVNRFGISFPDGISQYDLLFDQIMKISAQEKDIEINVPVAIVVEMKLLSKNYPSLVHVNNLTINTRGDADESVLKSPEDFHDMYIHMHLYSDYDKGFSRVAINGDTITFNIYAVSTKFAADDIINAVRLKKIINIVFDFSLVSADSVVTKFTCLADLQGDAFNEHTKRYSCLCVGIYSSPITYVSKHYVLDSHNIKIKGL